MSTGGLFEKRYVRKISKCYLVEEDSIFPDKLVKICRSKRLAEHYVRVLSPKWIEAFGFGLRVVEMPFYEDLDYDTMVVEVAEDSGIESIIEDVPKPVKINGGK